MPLRQGCRSQERANLPSAFVGHTLGISAERMPSRFSTMWIDPRQIKLWKGASAARRRHSSRPVTTCGSRSAPCTLLAAKCRQWRGIGLSSAPRRYLVLFWYLLPGRFRRATTRKAFAVLQESIRPLSGAICSGSPWISERTRSLQ